MLKTMVTVLLIISISHSSAHLHKKHFDAKSLELANRLHATCIIKSGTDEETIKKIQEGNFVEGDDKIKKYITCLFLDSNVVDSDGNLHLDVLREICPPKIKHTQTKMISQCWKEVGGVSPLDDKLYEIMKCAFKLNPEEFLMV